MGIRKILMRCCMTAKIAAWASHQRPEDETPYWRTLKAKGESNKKYPGGVEAQREKLEAEGHTVLQKGRKNIRRDQNGIHKRENKKAS